MQGTCLYLLAGSKESTHYALYKARQIIIFFTGTSSFGMSGVNAHMLFSKQPEVIEPKLARVENPNPKAPLSWRPQRFWPGPTLCHLVHPVSADSTSGTLR